MLKEVPDGATMVGNPARQVLRRGSAGEERPTFQPYGVDPDVSDPIARALTGLLDEVATLRARVSELEADRVAATSPVEAPAPAAEPRRRRVAGANP